MPSLRLLAVLTLTLTTVPVPPPAYAADPAALRHRVTLLTGDVVTYTDGAHPAVTVEQANRTEPAVFTIRRTPRGLYVTPSDADPNRLDRELFNVTALTDQDLAGTTTLPVIVTYPKGRHPRQAGRPLPSINGVALEVTKGQLREPIGKVWLDRRLRPALDVSAPQVGAPRAWQAGHDGTGVTVAVLDTGVDATHPDLAGKVIAAQSFVEGDESADDFHGHGTHVAATIASAGNRYRGVAPGARLAIGKVCDFGVCPESSILAGMDWATQVGAKVVNLSLSGAPTDGTDLLSQRVDQLTAQTGTLFVVAAGNDSCALCVGSPGAASSALTVGAVDRTDALAGFSNRGPRHGDGAVKPDLVAPGVAITAARAKGTLPGHPGDEHHVTLSGTSMATPHVAGAAAILAQARPSARATELKDALVSSARDTGRAWNEQGAGRLDIPAALRPVSATASVSLGHHSTGTTTYTNRGDTPVDLDLALTTRGWDGSTTTAAQLSSTTLTVPAHGSATVDLTVTDPPPGLFGGVLTASFDGTTLRTPVSWHRPYPAQPRHRITVTMLDRAGRPLPDQYPWIVRDRTTGADNPNDPLFISESLFGAEQTTPGTWVAQVPPGDYALLATHTENRPEIRRQTLLAATNVTVNGPASVTLDERTAVRATATTPEPTYRYDHQLTYGAVTATGEGVTSVISTGALQDAELYATPVPAARRGLLAIAESYTLGQRAVLAQAGYTDLRPEYEPYQVTRALPGSRTLPVVFAGDGSAMPDDVRGKAVLVRLPMPTGSSWSQQVSRAADTAAGKALAAGAVALLPYLDVPGALPIRPLANGPLATPLPLLGIRNTDGERLRTRPGIVLNLDVQTNPKYLYSLHLAPPPGIPGNLTHQVRPGELLRTRTSYHADVPGLAVQFRTFAFERDGIGTYLPTAMYLNAPAMLDHYVGGATGKQFWQRQTRLTDGRNQFAQIDFQPYRDRVESWFAGPITMVAPDHNTLTGFVRDADHRFWASSYLSDSSLGHEVNIDSGPVYPFRYRLFHGTTELPARKAIGHTPHFELPSEPAEYRLEGTFTLPTAGVYGPNDKVRRMSPEVANTWIFRSAPGQTRPPLLHLRYQLGVDLTNHAPAGRSHTIGLTAPTSVGATVSYSTDGTTWRTAPIIRQGLGRYGAVLAHPPTPGTDISLRTTAWDAAGNRITQTVRSAYRLSAAAS